MRVRRFEWGSPGLTANLIRVETVEGGPEDLWKKVDDIGTDVLERKDEALIRLSAKFDGVEMSPEDLWVDPAESAAALAATDPELREAMEVAVANIRAVAKAQVDDDVRTVQLPQGQRVAIREVPVARAGVYAPGGRAAYASSVLMCAIPARVAGVGQIALASPPGPDGRLSSAVLAAAALCEVDELYALGGAQAIFALAYGTETVNRTDVIVGPGSTWVQEAKRIVSGFVGIDSYAGPSELMVIASHDTNPDWVALDLCAQAEHGADSPLVVAAVEEHVLDEIEKAVQSAAARRESVADAQIALVRVIDSEAAIEFANEYAPEHLEILAEDAALLADKVTTAGCVFVGRFGATAFGDYVAGSNHVLPTAGSGRHSGPLGPGTFRRKISTVEIPPDAAAKLARHADTIARAEGFPVHGESAMIRTR